MIKHSEFAKQLIGVSTQTMPGRLGAVTVEEVLRLSQHGVLPEGGDGQALVNQASDNSTVAAPALPGKPTGFRWGKSSLAELQDVKEELVECATLALTRFSAVDFRCHDGFRTLEEQRRHVRNGTSRTMNSKHLRGLAVDLVPVIGGVLKWDWDGCYEIAWAMDQAATHMGIAGNIRWGGAWDRVLADYGNTRDAYKKEVAAYQNRHPGPDFIDGPHFEWVN
jgi:peptidoglycan L-alanyl-D-glutamate endopeptidase CwlK